MVVSGIFLPLPFPLRFRSLGRGGLSFGLGTLGTDVDGWGRLYHDGAASATDGPLLCLPAASYLFEEAADGGPERLHHPFSSTRSTQAAQRTWSGRMGVKRAPQSTQTFSGGSITPSSAPWPSSRPPSSS